MPSRKRELLTLENVSHHHSFINLSLHTSTFNQLFLNSIWLSNHYNKFLLSCKNIATLIGSQGVNVFNRRNSILKINCFVTQTAGMLQGNLVVIGNQHSKLTHKKLISNSSLDIALSIIKSKSVSWRKQNTKAK